MYSMSATTRVAQQAADDITHWLRGRSNTVSVVNVENDPTYQRLDIDLLWTTTQTTYRVEVKGDRLHHTGNFFFETHSNWERGTPGCFLYTEADMVFYYFVGPRTLYILPMPQTRQWFLANSHRFRERSTRTPIHDGYYTTVGRVVPISVVQAEVDGVRQIQLSTPPANARHN
jgi:hypothetical protein